MKYINIAVLAVFITITSCGKKNNKNTQDLDTTSIDTAGVEQLENELKKLEEQSSQINQKIDSIDNLLNE